jgi:hypothetical protein
MKFQVKPINTEYLLQKDISLTYVAPETASALPIQIRRDKAPPLVALHELDLSEGLNF